jgi:RimJ/RimL family protein N-acetyltransferase
MPSPVELSDGDLVLRPWRGDDPDAIGYTPRDPEIGTYLGAPLSGDFPPTDPDAPWFAIVENGEPVGRIWFPGWKRPFEVGYYLRPDAEGRGLATRSLEIVCTWMAAQGEETIELCVHPNNERSHRVAERAGCRRAGEVEEYARFKDGTTRALRYVWP